MNGCIFKINTVGSAYNILVIPQWLGCKSRLVLVLRIHSSWHQNVVNDRTCCYIIEELNRKIRENGINSRLSCIYSFKTLPGCLITATNTAYFAFFPDFSNLFSDSDYSFWDPWVPLTFFPAVTLVVYHIPIKIREKNNLLTQHSVNAHTTPLSEKKSLS